MMRRLAPPFAFASLLAVMVATPLIDAARMWIPTCGMRRITGLACPLCGGTRSVLAWTHLDFSAAFWMNPLVGLACLGVCGWFLFWVADRMFRLNRLKEVEDRLLRLPLFRILIPAALGNWIYLCLSSGL